PLGLTLFPYTTLFRSNSTWHRGRHEGCRCRRRGWWCGTASRRRGRGFGQRLSKQPERQAGVADHGDEPRIFAAPFQALAASNAEDRKSTRLNSSHVSI